MAFTKRPAGGTKVEIATTTLTWLGPWTTVNGFTGTINLPGGTSSKVDITTHDDVLALGRLRQNGAGLADVSDPGGTVMWDPDDAIHQMLLAGFLAGSVYQFRFTFPGGVIKKYGVQGQISVGTPTADINGYLQTPLTIVANAVKFDVT
jgi:hypothetical protein